MDSDRQGEGHIMSFHVISCRRCLPLHHPTATWERKRMRRKKKDALGSSPGDFACAAGARPDASGLPQLAAGEDSEHTEDGPGH